MAIVGWESGDGAVVESGHLEAIFRSSAIVVTLQKPGWRQVDKPLRGGLVAGQCWHRLIGEAEQGTHLHRRRYMYYEAASRITSVQGPILTNTATEEDRSPVIDVCCMRGVNRTTLARLFITYRTANGL